MPKIAKKNHSKNNNQLKLSANFKANTILALKNLNLFKRNLIRRFKEF